MNENNLSKDDHQTTVHEQNMLFIECVFLAHTDEDSQLSDTSISCSINDITWWFFTWVNSYNTTPLSCNGTRPL